MQHWRRIPTHPDYSISCTGKVYSYRTKRVLKPSMQWNGYEGIVFSVNKKIKRFTIHRLVAEAFVTRWKPEANTVDHIDNNKLNNRADNLEWVTDGENRRRAIADGLAPPPPRWNTKLTEEQVRYIRSLPSQYGLQPRLARQFNVSKSCIAGIRSGQKWKNIV